MIKDALFKFQGRLGRLAFLGWNLAALALVAAIVVAFLILGAGLSLVLSPSSGGPQVLGLMTVVTGAGAAIWTTLALTVKRVRDTGLAPWPVTIGAILLLMVDYAFLTRFTDVRFFSPFAGQTPLGGLLATGWFAFLVCWPGAAAPRNSSATDNIMRGAAIAISLFAVVAGVAFLTPLNYFVGARHALAQRAFASGWPSVSAALLSPLAELQDARAENNLAVLRARGVGTAQDFAEARRLFARAADHGSVRARLNSIMIAK
ncbi:MAG TPA: DUF805 domain-containing protein, partial [Bradyrhizobium sp.]|nr:DUF805 domain-containing protein [Bradyrhizobium sp.]